MEKVNNGGPAFPREDYQSNGYDKGFEKLGQEGMSLRDYFAAKAIGVIAFPADYVGTKETEESYKQWAQKAYRMADAMLKARG
ncbi:hypothetical protein [Enterobacter sichuanensis]|uniref:hypothetical protein n=1 Tax=Enterobacter sichuanensis TaxID=2071710 RepID=UPI00217EB589|nr:hypothetical protein [Enterobacter sichuanensis]